MRTRTGVGEPRNLRHHSANDRFKARWKARVASSTILAVAAHAALFMASPSWEAPRLTPDDAGPATFLEVWRVAPATTAPAGGGPGVPASPVVEAPDPTEADEPGLAEGPHTAGTGLDDFSAALQARLLRRGFPRPTVTEPEVEPDEVLAMEEVSPVREGADSGGADAAITDLVSAPDPDSLDLNRLSALRPELAIMAPSAWVLIRNPTEVETFLRRSYRRGRLDPDARGSVGVTLWIDERGSVEWAEISRSSGLPELDEIALALFNEVVAFRPAREQGAFVSRSVTFSVNFPW